MAAAEGFEEFVSIVDCGSLSKAAEELNLPRPTLSRRLARLEERLGVQLIHRTTRRLKVSPQGEVLYERARRVVQTAREVESDVRRLDGVPRGLLRVSVPSAIPPVYLGQWLVDFLGDYPELKLEVVGSSEHVDLIGEGFDVAFRAGEVEDQSLRARTLARDLRMAVASPKYLDRVGHPQQLEDFADHNCILGFKAGKVPEQRWPLLDGGFVPVSGTLAMNQMTVRLQTAILHLGIALVVERIASQEIADGKLVPVLPNIVGRRERLSLVYPDQNLVAPKVRAFVDFFAARIEATRAKRDSQGDEA